MGRQTTSFVRPLLLFLPMLLLLPAASALSASVGGIAARSPTAASGGRSTKIARPPAGSGARSRTLPPNVRTTPGTDWEVVAGNYVLAPTNDDSGRAEPKAVVHFLGGAFFGAAPHVSYRYLLERLADEGCLVVATPFDVSFDHLLSTKTVRDLFEGGAVPALRERYGDDFFDRVPTVNVGHSNGALLHLLSSTGLADGGDSKFPKNTVARSANVFISFNNRPASESIPYIDEIIAPVARYLARTTDQEQEEEEEEEDEGISSPASSSLVKKSPRSDVGTTRRLRRKPRAPSRLERIRMVHEARAAFDVSRLLRDMETAEKNAGKGFDFLLHEFRRADEARRNGGRIADLPPFKVPQDLPDSVFSRASRSGLSAALRPAKRTLQAVTLANQIFEAVDGQVPLIAEQLAAAGNNVEGAGGASGGGGRPEFSPSPESVRELVRRSYSAGRTLLVQFDDDDLDQSEEIRGLLRSSHPGSTVDRALVGGGHNSPLLAPPLRVARNAESAMGRDRAIRSLGYGPADESASTVISWLAGCGVLGGEDEQRERERGGPAI